MADISRKKCGSCQFDFIEGKYGDTKIRCKGFCGFFFHKACVQKTITVDADLLDKSPNLTWMCTTCTDSNAIGLKVILNKLNRLHEAQNDTKTLVSTLQNSFNEQNKIIVCLKEEIDKLRKEEFAQTDLEIPPVNRVQTAQDPLHPENSTYSTMVQQNITLNNEGNTKPNINALFNTGVITSSASGQKPAVAASASGHVLTAESSRHSSHKKGSGASSQQQQQDNFQEIKSKRKRRPLGVIGTGAINEEAPFKAAQRTGHVYVGRLEDKVTSDIVKNYVIKNIASLNDTDIEVCKLETKSKLSAFRISLPFDYLEKIKMPELWPKGTIINRFYFPRKQNFQYQNTVNLNP
jgi:hypothetical protein